MACKTWEAEDYAAQEVKKIYPDDTHMQFVAEYIGEKAITAYRRKLNELRKKPKSTDGVTK